METGKTLCLASLLIRQNTGKICKTELGVAMVLVEKKLRLPRRGNRDF